MSVLERPRARRRAALLLCMAGSGCGGDAVPSPAHVFLISLDTVSAKHCSAYGCDQPTTPFLEELAERGAVFERHMVNTNNTLKSHASMLTGLLPLAHDTWDEGEAGRRALGDSYVTLAERFRDAGFSTGAFATHATWLVPSFGLAQGFEHFASDWIGAEDNNAAILAWFDRVEPKRSFTFLHYFDAHSDGSEHGDLPYEAPPAWLERLGADRPADFDGSTEARNGEVVWGSRALAILANPWREVPPGHLDYLVKSYRAGLAKLDHDLRALFGELERRGLLDDALIVVTSDHGEEFKEHRGLLHQQFYDEVMHVPLIVVLPRGMPPARARVAELTRSIDIAPTMLELAGLELHPMQGRSLASCLTDGAPLPYGDTLFELAILRARDGRGEYKLNADPLRLELYDLDDDPAELVDLLEGAEPAPQSAQRLLDGRARIARFEKECADVRAALGAEAAGGAPAASDAELERLKSLGYLGD